MDVISFQTEVHDKLINTFKDFVLPFQIIIVDSIGFSLRIGNHQTFGDGQVQFLRRQFVDLCIFLNELYIT